MDERIAQMAHHRISGLSAGDPVALPITPASTYLIPGMPVERHQYGRWTNPGWDALEEALGILEDATVVTFPSGMAAIAAVLLPNLHSGDKVLLPSDGYYTTRAIAENYLAPNGIEVQLCDTVEYINQDFTGFNLVWIETPSNPKLEICDLGIVIEKVHAAGAIAVVDNTTLSPLGQRPFDFGADVVVSADTKSIGGHSDVLFGHIASRNEVLITKALDWRKLVGATPGPFEAWQVHRSLDTFEVRYSRMCESAGLIAGRFEEHPAIESVRYPGLESHPQHDIAKRQLLRFGSVMGVTFASEELAEQFISNAEYVIPSTSFGGTHTSAERRARWGDAVVPGYVRLSIGVEPTEELWKSFERSLAGLAG